MYIALLLCMISISTYYFHQISPEKNNIISPEKKTVDRGNMKNELIKDPYESVADDLLPNSMVMSKDQKKYIADVIESISKIIDGKSSLEEEEKLYGDGIFFWPKNPDKPTEASKDYSSLKIRWITLQFDRKNKEMPWEKINFYIKPKNFPAGIYVINFEKSFFSKLTLINCILEDRPGEIIEKVNVFYFYLTENKKIKYIFEASPKASTLEEGYPRSFHILKITKDE